MWPDRRLMDLFKIEHPIVLGPMAGAVDADLAIEVSEAGALGSLPVRMLRRSKCVTEIAQDPSAHRRPFNVNFFCHKPPVPNNAREHAWRERLKPYYVELGIDPAAPVPSAAVRRSTRQFCAAGRRIEAAGRELPFRLARRRAAQTRQGGGLR